MLTLPAQDLLQYLLAEWHMPCSMRHDHHCSNSFSMATWKLKVETLIGKPLRDKQVAVLKSLLERHHTLGILPCGYGKSVCFGGFPTAFNELYPEEECIALVISPLNALSANHQESWLANGVNSLILRPRKEVTDETIQAVKRGEYQLLIASPEVVHQDLWWEVMKQLDRKVKLLAIDEIHCLSKWGTSFRPDYLRVVELRAILPSATLLGLTATATADMTADVSTKLGLKTMKIIALSADRPEIFISMEKCKKDMADTLGWYAKMLLEQQENCPRAIIYAGTINAVTRIYFYLNRYLGDKCLKDCAFGDVNARLVEMYHGRTDEESQERVVTNFRNPNSPLRCVSASIAFGLGVDIPNIRYVIHWGPPHDALAYWQEIGRCSRDGVPGRALTYIYPGSVVTGITNTDMMDITCAAKANNTCLRQKVLSKLHGSSGSSVPARLCCSYCLNVATRNN